MPHPPPGNIRLEIRPLSELRPHEETVAGLSERVLRALEKDRVQRDPVIVDGSSGTILDGTHRVEALGRAGARSALTFVVDYRDPGVRLFRWFRVVRVGERGKAMEVVRELGLERVGPPSEAGGSPLRVVVSGAESYAIGGATAGLEEQLELVRRFDAACAERGLRVEFLDEVPAAPRGSSAGEPVLALVPPSLSKDDVLRAGAEGRPFPPKSTLHVFPYRPLGVRYPVEDLRAGRDVLQELLGDRSPRMLGASRGRREPVVVYR
ncbi:MAG: hypothetical protein ABSF83_09810 [Nitrososphaerales archaeon]